MLSNIELENFKCFKNTTSIDIKPLTLLCGPNSSGKSSIIKSLLINKQSYDSKYKEPALQLSGNLVDSGIFDDTVFQNQKEDNNSFRIKHTFEINNYKYKSKARFLEKREDFHSFKELESIYNKKGSLDISKYLICVDIECTKNEVKQSKEDDAFMRYLADNYISKYTFFVKAKNQKGSDIRSIDTFIELIITPKKHHISWENLPLDSKEKSKSDSRNCIFAFSGLSIFDIKINEAGWSNCKQELSIIKSIIHIILSQYEGIHFIAPLRNQPEREVFLKSHVEDVGITGENTTSLLARIRNQKVVNNFDYLHSHETELTYKYIIDYWIQKKFNLGKLSITGRNGAISVKLDNHPLADIGFGVSQILPIITQGIYMNRENTLLVEQPEIHLHPKMALQIADFFIESAKTERNMIIETHSDHIVNRIIHRVMENYEELSSLVRIYYVNKTENGDREIIPIDIDPYIGTKIKDECPDFFVQYESETRDIVKTAMSNLIRDKK